MSLQSPFDSDFMMQLQSLQTGYMPGQGPSPYDMGSREAFMRQAGLQQSMADTQFQQQMRMATQLGQQQYQQQLGLQQNAAGLGAQAFKSQQETLAEVDRKARDRDMRRMMEVQAHIEGLEAAKDQAGDNEQAAIAQQIAQYKQRHEELQTKVIKAEASASGFDQLSKVERQKLLQSLDTELGAMEGLKNTSTANAAAFGDSAVATLRNKIQGARNAANGSSYNKSFTGFGSYSDAFFAMQDPDVLRYLAASGARGEAIAASAAEGGIQGYLIRGVESLADKIEGAPVGYQRTPDNHLQGWGRTLSEDLKLAQEQNKAGSRAELLFKFVGKDLADKMGVAGPNGENDLRALFSDLDSLKGVGDPVANKQVYDEIRGRIRDRVKKLGTTIGEENVIDFLGQAADAFSHVEVTGEKGVKTKSSRFATSPEPTGTVEDLHNAIGEQISIDLGQYAQALSSALGADQTIRRSADIRRVRDALSGASEPGKDGTVNLDSAALQSIMDPYRRLAASPVANSARYRQDVLDRLAATSGALDKGAASRKTMLELQEEQKRMALDPANLVAQAEAGAPVRAARVGSAKKKAADLYLHDPRTSREALYKLIMGR